MEHHRGSSDKECLMILKWWWSAWWERTQVWSVDSRYLWSRANKDLLIVWKISANPAAVWAPERVAWWQCSSQVSSFLKFWFILVCSQCQVPCPLTARRENNPNSALNHFGKHPSSQKCWEMPKMAQIHVNVIPGLVETFTLCSQEPVSQMMLIMTLVPNPDRHLMKVLVLFLNPQMTADGSFWLIWTYQVCLVQRGNLAHVNRLSVDWKQRANDSGLPWQML